MRIDGWYIDGFGVFRDYEVRGLVPGVTVFHGANEAGKSTLLAFLRGVLFGFPDGRSRDPKYPPLHGGTHGGRIFLESAEGLVTVEREAGRRRAAIVSLEDGSTAGDEALRDLLGGCDKQLFETVFAFSLTELQSFERLSADSVRDRIFSAGIAGAGRSAREVMQRLARRGEEFVKPRSGVAWELAAQIEEVERSLAEARRDAARYPELLNEETRLAEAVAEVRERRRHADQRLRRMQTLLELWPVQSQLEAEQRALSELPPVEGLPDEARLTVVLGAVDHARELFEKATEALRQEKERRLELERGLDERLPRVAAEVTALSSELSLHGQRLKELPEARQAREQAVRELERAVLELGEGWDEARVRGFDASIPRAEAVREWDRRLTDARQRREAARRELAEVGRRLRDAREEAERLRAALPEPEPPQAEVLDRAGTLLRALRTAFTARSEAESRRERLEREAADAELALRVEEVAAPAEAGIHTVLIAAGALLLLATIWAAATGQAVMAVVAAIVGALLILAGVHLRRAAAARTRAGERRAEVLADRRGLVGARRRSAAAAVAESERLGGEIDRLARLLGLGEAVTAGSLDDHETGLQRDREARRGYEDALARVLDSEARVRPLAAQMVRAEEDAGAAGRALDAGEADWRAYKAQLGVPPELSPQGVLDFFASVGRARAALVDRDAADSRATGLARAIEDWGARARAVLDAAPPREGEGDPAAAEPLVTRLLALQNRCADDSERRRKLADVRVAEEGCRATLAAAAERLGQATAARDELFRQAGVADADAYRERLELSRRRAGLESRVRELHIEIEAGVGRGEEAERMTLELRSGTLAEWQSAEAEARAEGEACAAEEEQRVRDHENARNQRRALAEAADVPRLEAEREVHRAQLAEAVEAWRNAEVARGLIEETLRVFERERQPRVLALASETFGAFTHGRYSAVMQDPEREGEVVVLDRSGSRRTSTELSRGTAEQLYLALRLGLVDEFAERAVALPLVLDDCLVNFDPTRARAVAEALARIAERHQVLLFTCHPTTVDLLRAIGAEAREVGG